jgi:hypothetical protein
MTGPAPADELTALTAPDTGGPHPMDAGPQPLDAILVALGWHNHDLVVRCAEGLTHKAVQKARRGRKITRRMQHKILDAVNSAPDGRRYTMEELFNYRGR